MADYGLGRLPFQEDPRDDQWPVARLKAMVAAGEAKPFSWSVPRILGQGSNPTCVSAGILGGLNCDDESHTDPGFTNADIVPFFQTIAGSSMTDGAELREGLKAAKAAGYILAYSLLRSLDEITDWLENHGPVLVGTYWLSDMDHPASDGRVTPTGVKRGGHCYYGHGDIQGYDWVNSWTVAWGLQGHFYTTKDDWLLLYNDYGEAWAVVQAVAPVKPRNIGAGCGAKHGIKIIRQAIRRAR